VPGSVLVAPTQHRYLPTDDLVAVLYMLCDMVRLLPWHTELLKDANVLSMESVKIQKFRGVAHYLTTTFAGIASRERRAAIGIYRPAYGIP
jgi:hypothetical protein